MQISAASIAIPSTDAIDALCYKPGVDPLRCFNHYIGLPWILDHSITHKFRSQHMWQIVWKKVWEQAKIGVGERECPGRERCPKGNRVRYVHETLLYIYPSPPILSVRYHRGRACELVTIACSNTLPRAKQASARAHSPRLGTPPNSTSATRHPRLNISRSSQSTTQSNTPTCGR